MIDLAVLKEFWWIFQGIAAGVGIILFLFWNISFMLMLRSQRRWLMKLSEALLSVDQQVVKKVVALEKRAADSEELLEEISKSLISLNEKIDGLKEIY